MSEEEFRAVQSSSANIWLPDAVPQEISSQKEGQIDYVQTWGTHCANGEESTSIAMVCDEYNDTESTSVRLNQENAVCYSKQKQKTFMSYNYAASQTLDTENIADTLKQADQEMCRTNIGIYAVGGGSKVESSTNNEERNIFRTMPVEALIHALPYMTVLDILSVEQVCRDLRDAIKNDIMLWQRLQIEPPLSRKLTNERLLGLVSRSKGQLQCLSLVDCLGITEAALQQILLSNPRISKLFLPGCSKINAEAVITMVRKHTGCQVSCLKQLRLRNIYGLTKEHLEDLRWMLCGGEKVKTSSREPQFYHKRHTTFSEDERSIDVEVCPKCSCVRMVYNCTRETCQQKFGECQACIVCIARCEECGRCFISDDDYEETFCHHLVCSSCWFKLPKCSDCNRPGCSRHADHFTNSTFTCSNCVATEISMDTSLKMMNQPAGSGLSGKR